ncbi:stalk domain-containing protein [Paenibacillaceae bacterium WGS1546]|uniref:stalk domain-containing protein n=1 Tax=Cohnella sp. WGS1546 TaxID=3366810 RepID=UPI00372CF78A
MNKTKRIAMTLGLFSVLVMGNTVHAAENFFWSDVAPTPSCFASRDGESGKQISLVIDDKEIAEELRPCEEAKKTFVIVQVNGKYLQTIAGTGAEPFAENGRTMIPLRAVADAFGFDVVWEQTEKKITLTKDGKQIVMHIGKTEMTVNGEAVSLANAAPQVKNNVTFLPVRPLAEILGIKVDWNAQTRTATFTEE